MIELHKPYVTQELGNKMSTLGFEITKSYSGVSGEVSNFVSSFRRSDRALIVASFEAVVQALKANFDPFDDLLYKLATLPGCQVIISSDIPIKGKERTDGEK